MEDEDGHADAAQASVGESVGLPMRLVVSPGAGRLRLLPAARFHGGDEWVAAGQAIAEVENGPVVLKVRRPTTPASRACWSATASRSPRASRSSGWTRPRDGPGAVTRREGGHEHGAARADLGRGFVPSVARRAELVLRVAGGHHRRVDPGAHRHQLAPLRLRGRDDRLARRPRPRRGRWTSAGLGPEAIDLVIVATITPERPMPSTAAYVQSRLGMHCPAFDMNAACAGFVYALSVASAQITAGARRTASWSSAPRRSRGRST